jgi:hypothetical protein
VRDQLQKDFDGTLKQVAASGYRKWRWPDFYNRRASDVRKSLEAAGLSCPSAHYPLVEPMSGLEEKIACAKDLGLLPVSTESIGVKRWWCWQLTSKLGMSLRINKMANRIVGLTDKDCDKDNQ